MKNIDFIPRLIAALPALFLSALFVSSSANADATLSMQADGQSRTLQVKDGQLFMSMPEEQTDVLFDSANQTMKVIDHKQKSVYPINEQSLSAIKSQVQGLQGVMSQAMQGLSPEQRQQMQSMLGGFGLGGSAAPAKEPQTSIKAAGDGQYAGVSCEKFQISIDGVDQGTACISSGNSLGISKADYQTLKSAQDFMFQMGREAGDLAKQFGARGIPNYGDFEANGILVSSKSAQQQGSFEITSIDKGSIDGALSAPAGYQTKDIASQMQ